MPPSMRTAHIGEVERFVRLVALREAFPRAGSAEARRCRRDLGMIYGVDLDPLDRHRASLPDGGCVSQCPRQRSASLAAAIEPHSTLERLRLGARSSAR